MPEAVISLTVRLPRRVWAEAKRAAKKDDRTLSKYISLAVENANAEAKP